MSRLWRNVSSFVIPTSSGVSPLLEVIGLGRRNSTGGPSSAPNVGVASIASQTSGYYTCELRSASRSGVERPLDGRKAVLQITLERCGPLRETKVEVN